MKALLVPYDFSENAENALNYALVLAKKNSYALHLLHVCPIPYEFAVRIEEAVQSLEDGAKSQMKNLVSKLKANPDHGGISIVTATTVGKTVVSVLQYAREKNVALIVMGTKGASGITKKFLGSNTAEVVKRSDIPVLIIPRKASYHDFSQLFYAFDYKNDNLKSINRVVIESRVFGLDIYTVYVAPKESLIEEMIHDHMKSYLNQKFSGVFDGHHLIYDQSPLDGLQKFIKEHPNGLFVFTPHTKDFLKSLWNVSISQEMSYETIAPILVINVNNENRGEET